LKHFQKHERKKKRKEKGREGGERRKEGNPPKMDRSPGWAFKQK
jgi:hypothetical protein